MKKTTTFTLLFLGVLALLSCEKDIESAAVASLYNDYWLSYDEAYCPSCGKEAGAIGIQGFIWQFSKQGSAVSQDIKEMFGFIGSSYQKTSYRFSSTASTITLSLADGTTDEWTGSWKVTQERNNEDLLILSNGVSTKHLHHLEYSPLSQESLNFTPPETTFSFGGFDTNYRCKPDQWNPISKEEFDSYVVGGYWVNLLAVGINDDGTLDGIHNYWEGSFNMQSMGDDSPPVYKFTDEGFMKIKSPNLKHLESFYSKSGHYTYKADDCNSVWLPGEKQPHLQILKMAKWGSRLYVVEYLGWSTRHTKYKYVYSIYERVEEDPYKGYPPMI